MLTNYEVSYSSKVMASVRVAYKRKKKKKKKGLKVTDLDKLLVYRKGSISGVCIPDMKSIF